MNTMFCAETFPAGIFHGEKVSRIRDEIPEGTFHGGDEIPVGTFH